MTDFKIRAGTLSDSGGIAELINYEIRTGLAIWRDVERSQEDVRAMIKGRLDASQAIYVAETANILVGWASYGPFRTGEGYGRTMEHSVHIKPNFQRLGIATALMKRLLGHAENSGVHALIGAIDAANDGSIRMHEKLGFAEVGRLPEVGRKFEKWLTLSLMQKTF